MLPNASIGYKKVRDIKLSNNAAAVWRFRQFILVILLAISGCSSSEDGTGKFNRDASLRIMAVGDSITHGVTRAYPSGSWRQPFTRSLDEEACSYEMVGSQLSNEIDDTFLSPHEAYAGHQANHFLTGRNDGAGSNDGIFISLANHFPELVLLHIGTNDAIDQQDNHETLAEIDQIISASINRGADVLVANLIPTYASSYLPGTDAHIEELGDLINAYVTQLASPGVVLVDVRSGYTSDMMFDDGIHPNDAGANHIAAAFYREFINADYCF